MKKNYKISVVLTQDVDVVMVCTRFSRHILCIAAAEVLYDLRDTLL